MIGKTQEPMKLINLGFCNTYQYVATAQGVCLLLCKVKFVPLFERKLILHRVCDECGVAFLVCSGHVTDMGSCKEIFLNFEILKYFNL